MTHDDLQPLGPRLRRAAAASAASAALLLSGCMNLTGLDASSTFSCPRSDGVPCNSLPETYEASLEEALPHQLREAERRRQKAAAPEKPAASESPGAARTPGRRIAGTANVRSAAAPEPNKKEMPAAAPQEPPAPAAPFESLAASASPGRIPEKLLRLWIAPWTDEDGDLHDASYVFVRVAEARWATAKRREPTGEAVVPLPFGRAPRPGRDAPESSPQNPSAAALPFGAGAAGMTQAKGAFARELSRMSESAERAMAGAGREVRRDE